MSLENLTINKAQRLVNFAKINYEHEKLAKAILLKDKNYQELLKIVKKYKNDKQ